MLLPVEGHSSFLGGATLYRDRQKIDVHAELLSGKHADGSQRWWGTLTVLGEDEPLLGPGTAYVRFSDGTDAQVALLTSDGHEASFEIIKLGTLEPDMTRWAGTRREASAQDPLSDWPKPAGT
jgi:hypothetical protein